MDNVEELAMQLKDCTPQQCRVIIATMSLALALKDVDQWTRQWARETVAKLLDGEPPEDLATWKAVVEAWE